MMLMTVVIELMCLTTSLFFFKSQPIYTHLFCWVWNLRVVFDFWPACHAWQLGKITKRSASKLQRCPVLDMFRWVLRLWRVSSIKRVVRDHLCSSFWFQTVRIVLDFLILFASVFGVRDLIARLSGWGRRWRRRVWKLGLLTPLFCFPPHGIRYFGKHRNCLCVWHFLANQRRWVLSLTRVRRRRISDQHPDVMRSRTPCILREVLPKWTQILKATKSHKRSGFNLSFVFHQKLSSVLASKKSDNDKCYGTFR